MQLWIVLLICIPVIISIVSLLYALIQMITTPVHRDRENED